MNEKKEVAHGQEFVELMLKLDAAELCALCKVLDVRLLTDEVDPETKKAIPRDGIELIENCIDHFAQMNRVDRRWLLKYLRKHTKDKE